MMTLFINHCWCSKDHRSNDNFDCSAILDIPKYPRGFDDIYDAMKYVNNDWVSLIEYDKDRTPNLKPEIIEFLDDNFGSNWCIGNKEYRSNETNSLNVFFVKPSDANKFAKEFSLFGKVVEKVDRFKDKKYILKDKKMVEVEDWKEEFKSPEHSYTSKKL